jgi:hypothetical protein
MVGVMFVNKKTNMVPNCLTECKNEYLKVFKSRKKLHSDLKSKFIHEHVLLGVQTFANNITEQNLYGKCLPMGLSEELKVVIENYFEKFPNMSINGLSRKSNVPATTLRRIINCGQKKDISPLTVLNIISSIEKERKLSKLLVSYDGKIGEILEKNFSCYIQSDNSHVYDPDLNELLKDKINYLIYKLAANRSGVPYLTLVELFGDIGIKRVECLLELGVLQDDDGIMHAQNKHFCLDISIAKENLKEVINFYKPEQIDKGQNLFYSLSESINLEGIQKIKRIQKDATKKIFEIMESEQYHGDIPYFHINVSDTLSYEENGSQLQ